jgi:renierapurpurin 18,18'-hydroxylase
MTQTIPAQNRTIASEEPADLRRVGISPDFWYPVAVSASVRREKTFAARFAGERIALYRSAGGVAYALEDRCAHRQVPLSMGVVEGEALRCCYHAWAYRGDGRISQIPYLPKGAPRPPRGVRAYPVREAYGLVFVFPGDPSKADGAELPDLPEFASEQHKTMTYSRTVNCHYSFLHENLLDMNHQFLHRGVVGRIHPELLDYETGLDWVQARYQFTHTAGKKSAGAALLTTPARSAPHVITIRTGYPYQTLHLSAGNGPPAFSLWAAYVPEDAGQRTSHTFGLLMIAKPPVRGALNLAWPLIRRFTERVFAEDRMAVEAEQRAWDEQGRDCNREVFPLILDVRDVLRSNGVPIGPEPGCSARCLGVSAGEAAVPPGSRMTRRPIGEPRELPALPCSGHLRCAEESTLRLRPPHRPPFPS